MKWTREKPTEAGVYWLFSDGWPTQAVITEVYFADPNNAIVMYASTDDTEDLDMVEGWWQGPLQPNGVPVPPSTRTNVPDDIMYDPTKSTPQERHEDALRREAMRFAMKGIDI